MWGQPGLSPTVLILSIVLSPYVFLRAFSSIVVTGQNDASDGISSQAFSCPVSSVPQISFLSPGKTALTEPQPSDFHCEFTYKKKGTAIPSVEVLVFIIGAMGEVAVEDYQQRIEAYTFNDPGLTLLFSSSKAPGQQGLLRAKHILWSLRLTSCYMFLQSHWGEIGFHSRYLLQPIIGSGQLNRRRSPSETADGVTNNGSDLVLTRSRGNMTNPTKHIVTLDKLEFADQGPTFKPFDIYTTIISILVIEGDLEADAPQGSVSGYNGDADLSVGIECTSRASVENLTNRIAIEALVQLAELLPNVDTRVRWKSVQFVVRNDGAIVGRGIIKKGTIPRRAGGCVGSNGTEVVDAVQAS